MIRITVLSQHAAEHYQPRNPAVCISITATCCAPAMIPDRYREVLRLVFDDVDTGSRAPRRHDGSIPFTPEMARQIASFVRKNLDVFEVVVHCRQGVSRSAGVAMALADTLAGGTAPTTFAHRLPFHHGGVRAATRAACLQAGIPERDMDIRSGPDWDASISAP